MPLIPVVMLAFALQQEKADPVCTADVRWAVTEPPAVSRRAPARAFSLFSATGNPACGAAELKLTVAYFTAADELVCSGAIDAAVPLARTQLTTLELRVANLLEFVRWRNGPASTAARPKQLDCYNADGTAPVQPAEFETAASMRVYATVNTRYGALATAELRLLIQP